MYCCDCKVVHDCPSLVHLFKLSAVAAQTELQVSGFSRIRARLHIWHVFCRPRRELAKGMRSGTKTDCKTEGMSDQAQFLLRDSVFSKELYSVSHFLKKNLSSLPFPSMDYYGNFLIFIYLFFGPQSFILESQTLLRRTLTFLSSSLCSILKYLHSLLNSSASYSSKRNSCDATSIAVPFIVSVTKG